MWYSLFNKSTGALWSHSSTEPIPDAAHEVSSDADRQDQINQWNPTLRAWEPRPTERRITTGALMENLTDGERAAFYNLDNKSGRTVDRALISADRLGYIDLDAAPTGDLLSLMVFEGVITEARKTELLAN
tara:strand:+ start:28199 stop:28591 length:393 start_codon:yes stop_codon:yes gene_type:complete